MKRFVFLTATLITICSTVVSKSLEAYNENEKEIEGNLESGLKHLKSFLVEDVGAIAGYFAIFERSVDIKCAAEQLKSDAKHKRIFNNLLSKENRSRKEQVKFNFILLKATIPCSNKIRSVSNFVFDAIMSLGHLARAFKDEPEIREISNPNLKCLNYYAVSKGLFDVSQYELNPVDHKFENELHQINFCNRNNANVELLFNEILENEPECMRKLMRKSLDSLLRTVLLMQVELSPEQRKIEQTLFFDAEIEAIKQEGSCRLETLSREYESDEEGENMELKINIRNASSSENEALTFNDESFIRIFRYYQISHNTENIFD